MLESVARADDLGTAIATSSRGALVARASTDTHVVLYGPVYFGGNVMPLMGALCTVRVDSFWHRQIPKVACHELWITRDVDWHVYPDGTLCVDLDIRWTNAVLHVAKYFSTTEVSRFAADYLLNSVAWLIERHRIKFEHGLEIWPESWPAWSHGNQGEHEYYRSIRAA